MIEEGSEQVVEREEKQQVNGVSGDNNHEDTANEYDNNNVGTRLAESHPTQQAIQERLVAPAEQQQEQDRYKRFRAPSQATYDAGPLKIHFVLRKFSLKITVVVHQAGEEKPQDLQELLASKKSNADERFSVMVTRTNMPLILKKHFQSLDNLYNHIFINLKNEDKVTISKDEIRLVLPSDTEKPKLAKIDLKGLREERYKHELPATMDDMQDSLLQFSSEEIEFIDKCYLISEGQEEAEEPPSNELMEWLQYINDSDDEESFLEKWGAKTQEEEVLPSLSEIEQQENEMQEFEKKFPQFKKALPSYSTNTPFVPRPASDDKMTNASGGSKTSVFPPGYVPPHLMKQTASDGLSSDQHLRFQANQSKKEKLKLAKQMLKMGYSTSEVISKLEALEKANKTGGVYVDPNPTPSQKSAKSTPAPSVQSRPPPVQNNDRDRAVKEMLIALIRAKTYKKLQDIHRHMINEGLETSLVELKRIIDEIKAKTAQRKAQARE